MSPYFHLIGGNHLASRHFITWPGTIAPRLPHVLDATPEEIIAPAAPHLWGDTETKAVLLLATIVKLRTFDEEVLQDVFSLLSRIEEICSDGGNAAAKRASTRPTAVDGEQDPD
ncbi:hypothetical protein [Rhizobium giardinii]|uniref:Uncharacterized protein n=1 Tax=Rhizobium giardinii TaxID=56731 RepID=A0A7W8UBW9_9HYPH|nr:hypothetical protein [Rhizobium giardinii]MBB5536458.1 hypothetical protein [Rhizobium giardinii]